MKPRMFYFGPLVEAGHYLFDERGRILDDSTACPWDPDSPENGIDCQLQPGCTRSADGRWTHGKEIQGQALLHHRNGWTALSFWDRSVDESGGCNSTYFAEGTFTFEEMVELARARFAARWNRMKFDVRLAEQPKAAV